MKFQKPESIDSETGVGQEQEQEQEQGKGASVFGTCFNGINTLTGVGILSVPFALSEAGWMSLILLLVIAILCWYTGLLLKLCMDSNPLIKTYPDIGHQAFGYKGRLIVSVFIYVELYLVAVEFLILEGDNLDKLFPNATMNIAGLKIKGKQAFVMLTALLIWPTTLLRSLRSLAYVSAGGILASVVVVACVFWVGEFDGVGFHERGKLLNLGGIPTAVLLICFIISTMSYASMAVIGYVMYGEHAKSQVTLNLPVKKISTQIAIYTTLINPITKYALVISPIVTTIERTPFFKNNIPLSITLRTSIVISTVVLALTFPFFGYVMAFIGAFLGVVASILLPCIFYLKIEKSSRRFGVKLVMIVGILVFGTCVGAIGTYTSIKQIVNHL